MQHLSCLLLEKESKTIDFAKFLAPHSLTRASWISFHFSSLLFILTAMLRYRFFISHIINDFMIYLFLLRPANCMYSRPTGFLNWGFSPKCGKIGRNKGRSIREKSVKREKQHSLAEISKPFRARNEF